MKVLIPIFLSLIIVGCEEAQREPHPMVQTVNYVLEVQGKLKPDFDLLMERRRVAEAEYNAALAKEHSFLAELTDEELIAYEKYTDALKPEASPAALHLANRELKGLLEPKNKYLTFVSLRGEIYYAWKKLQSIYDFQERYLDKLREIQSLEHKMQFKPCYQLTSDDYVEMSRIRREVDGLKQSLEEFHKNFERTYIQAEDIEKQVNE